MSDLPGLDQVRLVVSGGGGYVARRAGALIVLPQVPGSASSQADRLLSIFLDEALAGRSLMRRIAYQLGEPDSSDTPGFCLLVAQDGCDPALLAYGSVEVHLPGEASPLSPAQQLTWAERSVTQLSGLTVAAPGSPLAKCSYRSSLLDLRAGVITGSAVRLLSAEATAHLAPASPAPSEPASGEVNPANRRSPDVRPTLLSESQAVTEALEVGPQWAAQQERPIPERRLSQPPQALFEAVRLTDDTVSADAPAPLPMTGEKGDDDRILVEGCVCPRGHFNDPRSEYCSDCGTSMSQRNGDYVSAPRPPLGVLIFDDGSAFSVDGNYVLGREPELDSAVISGQAMPLRFDDQDHSISRVHAVLRLDGWRVLLEDRDSANGTFVAQLADAGDWRRLVPAQPAVLTPGLQVRFGRRVAVFESHTARQ